MPLANTIQINYSESDFKDGNAKFAPKDLYKGMVFANVSTDLLLGNAQYGFVKMEVTYTTNAPLDSASVFVCHPDGAWGSLSEAADDAFNKVNSDGFYHDIKLTANTTKTIFFIANIDDNIASEPTYTVNVALGKRLGTTTGTVTISYDCVKTPFMYEAGMHVYSPYDAHNSSKLTTTLYSFTPVQNWTYNTLLFASKGFDYPALPYYYSYGDNVYKVGGKLDRTYGTLTYFKTVKRAFSKVKIYEYIEGPKGWYNPETDTSAACVVPVQVESGKIKQIISGSSLSQPTLYRYLGGYDANDIVKSNDIAFGKYSFGNKRYYPITGARHALEKITQGYISGWKRTWNPALWPLIAGGAGLFLAGIANGVILASWSASVASGSSLLGPFTSWLLDLGGAAIFTPVMGWIIAGIVALVALWALFRTRKETYKEPCLQFRHFYVQNEYIETGDEIWEDDNLTEKLNGYYCDGIYFYTQAGGTVTSRTLSYTNAIQSDDPIRLAFESSLPADDPTHVTNIQKLIVLPYMSGIPINVCGNGVLYTSSEMTATVTSDSAGDLMTCEDVTVTLPAGFEWSCISQEDANIRANSYFQSMLQQARDQANKITCTELDAIGEIDMHFTHELKNETTPNGLTCYYNNTDTLGLTVGKSLYSDLQGYYKVLDGYYGNLTESTPYKKFYKTVNGVVTEIWSQSTSASTTVTNGGSTVSLSTSQLNYTSEWYWYDNDVNALLADSTSAYNAKNNPNSYTSNGKIYKGIKLNGDECTTDLKTWNGSAWVAGETGWYRGLVDWIVESEFYYVTSRSVIINFESVCPTSATLNTPYGVKLKLVDGSGNPVTSNADTSFTLRTYNGATLLEEKTVNLSSSDVEKYVPHLSVSIDTSITSYTIVESPFTACKTTFTQGTTTTCSVNRDTGRYLLQKVDSGCGNTNITAIGWVVSAGIQSPVIGQYVKANVGGVDSCWKVLSTSETGAISAYIVANPYNACIDCNGAANPCAGFKITATTTNASSSSTADGTAKIVVDGGSANGPYQWYLGEILIATTSTPTYTYTNLYPNLSYTFKVVDTATECSELTTLKLGQTSFNFSADYMILTWEFTDGRDLDIKCRMVTPDVGQNSVNKMLGFGAQSVWPITVTTQQFLKWGGDNVGTGVEAVLFDITAFKAAYPGYTGDIKIDCRGHWYKRGLFGWGTKKGKNPVWVGATLYSGGAGAIRDGYSFSIISPVASQNLQSVSKKVNASGKGGDVGERIAVLTYNIGTGNGSFDTNDTTTPTIS